MKLKFRAPFSVAIASSVGIIVLAGYFFGANAAGEPNLLGILRDYFLQGAVVVAGVAALVGLFNLAAVHAKKIRRGDGAVYSLITLLALFATLLVGGFDLFMTYQQGATGLRWASWIFENIQYPIETSLMAILVVSLTFALTRLPAKRGNWMSGVFIATVILLLITAIPPVSARWSLIADLRTWVLSVPTVGGARGLLIGISLGVVATALRILMGADRPYGG